jgi:hypothetical protein
MCTEHRDATASPGTAFPSRHANPGDPRRPTVHRGLTKAQAEELLDRLEAAGCTGFGLFLADAGFVVVHW